MDQQHSHGAIFIPASPPSSGQPSPALAPIHHLHQQGRSRPVRSFSGSIMIPASPFASQPPSRKSTMFEPLTEAATSSAHPQTAPSSSCSSSSPPHPPPQPPHPPHPPHPLPPSSAPPATNPSRDHLIRISHAFIHAISRRDWVAVEAFASVVDHNCFRGQVTDFSDIDSFAATVDMYKNIASRASGVQVSILDTTCHLDEASGYASVYINVDATGQPGGVATQGVSIFEWLRRKRNGQWLLVRHTSLKGLEGIV